MTLVLSLIGLILEIIIVSEIAIPGLENHYNGVRVVLWFGVAGSAVRSFLQLRNLENTEKTYQKQVIAYSQNLAKLESELDQAGEWEEKHIALEKGQKELEQEKASLLEQVAQLEKELSMSKGSVAKLKDELSTSHSNDSDAGAVMLLKTLQSKGRFLDFIMNDISQYPDDRVGTVARVVHQGCHETVKSYFELSPIHQDKEGSQIEVEADAPATQYRVHGASSEDLPKTATLVHKGWRANSVNLPKFKNQEASQDKIIAPAEIKV